LKLLGFDSQYKLGPEQNTVEIVDDRLLAVKGYEQCLVLVSEKEVAVARLVNARAKSEKPDLQEIASHPFKCSWLSCLHVHRIDNYWSILLLHDASLS
jgi:hypothetical protein